MGYPQPSSNRYAVGGAKYFRLLTPLTSPGDIYESEQSGHALALGPQSDVANINVAYFDDQVPTFVNQTQLGPRRSFVGRIDARNTDTYAPTNRPGRVFFWPADLYDPSYVPLLGGSASQVTFITPVLDVIQYFSPQPSMVPTRNDKTFRFTDVPFDIDPEGGREGWLIIPCWGRQSAIIRCSNFTSGEVQLRVRGVNYFVNDAALAQECSIGTFNLDPLPLVGPLGGPVQLLLNSNPTTPDNTSSVLDRIRLSAGVFDALAIFISVVEPDGPTPLTVTVSDYVG
jgi:hypothetical protein